jgi:Ala-tRNA(Pro) deacylase
MSEVDVVSYLEDAHVPFSRRHHRYAVTAQEVAQAMGVSGYQVAKTVVVQADGDIWMAVLPAPLVLDLRQLRVVLKAHAIRLLREGEFASMFAGCEIGAEPPLGGLYRLPVVVDEELAQQENIIFNAGSHEEAITMRFADFARIEAPLVADIATRPAMYGGTTHAEGPWTP